MAFHTLMNALWIPCGYAAWRQWLIVLRQRPHNDAVAMSGRRRASLLLIRSSHIVTLWHLSSGV